MKLGILFTVLFGAVAFSGDLTELPKTIGGNFGYPDGELVVSDVKNEESSFEKLPVIEAWRIEGKTPYSFYPVVVSVAKVGTFFTEEIVALNAKVDALPDTPAPRGRGPFGSFSLGDGSIGGIHLSKHGKSAAVVSTMTMPQRGIDVRISVECPFGPESLVPVSGGEQYMKNMAADSGFDLKGLFVKANEFAATLNSKASGGVAEMPTRPIPPSASDTASGVQGKSENVEEARAGSESEKADDSVHWWWFGIAVTILLTVIIFKFSSRISRS